MTKVIAIDFDGVLRDSNGLVIEKGRNMVKEYYDSPVNCIIIYTARADVLSQYTLVKLFLEEHHIPYHVIKLGKLKYDILIDDNVERFEDDNNNK